MARVNGNIPVLPHVQAFADAVTDATGVRSIGTYNGHQPTPPRALDLFHPIGSGMADAICEFAIRNAKHFGIMYVISRQKIWNPSVSPYWRGMEDRGNATQNHLDHVHISFHTSGSAQPSGGSGRSTQELQEALNRLGFSLTVDGDYGPMTTDAVRRFQSQHGLTVDGVAGAQTWAKIDELLRPSVPQGPREDEVFSKSPYPDTGFLTAGRKVADIVKDPKEGALWGVWPADGQIDQRVHWVNFGKGWVALVSLAGDLAMDSPDGRKVHCIKFDERNTNQHWDVIWVDEFRFKMRHQHYGKFLTVRDGLLVLEDETTPSTQIFGFTETV